MAWPESGRLTGAVGISMLLLAEETPNVSQIVNTRQERAIIEYLVLILARVVSFFVDQSCLSFFRNNTGSLETELLSPSTIFTRHHHFLEIF
jgi:hypothetical protein